MDLYNLPKDKQIQALRDGWLDIGFARLLDTTAHDVASIDFVDRLCDHMLDGEPQRDDVCVLTATRLDGQSYARSLSSTPSELGALRRELRTWLSAWVHDERTQQDVLLAVSEAVSNAVEHGASSGTDRPIVVVATTAGDEVRITVRDHGVWREPVPSIERGRGIGIMRALMDDVIAQGLDEELRPGGILDPTGGVQADERRGLLGRYDRRLLVGRSQTRDIGIPDASASMDFVDRDRSQNAHKHPPTRE